VKINPVAKAFFVTGVLQIGRVFYRFAPPGEL
jgi:hypothetical protein